MITINSIIIYFWPQAWPQYRKTRYNVLCFSGLCDKVVIPTGLEPISKEPESFILSIELRNQMRCKDNKKKKRGTMSPFIF